MVPIHPNSPQIQVYVTGGTFDKDYNFITGQLYFKDTHLPKMFQKRQE